MFSTKLVLSAVAAALLAGTANAYNGTAHLGFYDASWEGCPPWNGPFAIAIPSALVGTEQACNVEITLSFGPPGEAQTTTAVFSGIYDAGGPEDVALSPDAFAALAGWPYETSLEGVTWSF
ncbi:hypothetical protein K438DRAFT_1948478 [Mycena galopus ATCC 62051]|nr:hypothetical protein K438DRAFT_1948478 [Mycena galopus ATCC 62051]